MFKARRARWLDERYANVDGIPFKGSVRTSGCPALFAGFSVDPARAAAMLPGQELHPGRLSGRGLLVIAVVHYKDTPIGSYVEFCIGLLCTRGPAAAPPLLPLLAPGLFGTGVYIYDLPVSTEISVKGGRGIWGMPKRQANLDLLVQDHRVSSQYDLDGRLVMRIDVRRPAPARVPFRMTGAGYSAFRGMLMKGTVTVQGWAEVTLAGAHRTQLLVGDHPRAEPLRALDIDPNPVFTGFVPSIGGVLHDHVETWFLTADRPPPPPAGDLESLVGLGLSEEWPTPPDRERSDALLAQLDPSEAVGRKVTA